MATANKLLTGLQADFADVSVSAVTEDSDYPAVNCLDNIHPQRVYKGTGDASSEFLTFDLGATTTLDGVFLDNADVAGASFYGDSVSTFDSGSGWSLTGQTFGFDPSDGALIDGLDGRVKHFLDLRATAWASTGFRYFGLEPYGATLPGGSGPYQLGAITFIKSLTEWAQNPDLPFVDAADDETDFVFGQGGSIDAAEFAPVRSELSLSFSALTATVEAYFKAIRKAGRSRPVFIARNFGNNAEAWLCYRIDKASMSYTGHNSRQGTPLRFREVV